MKFFPSFKFSKSSFIFVTVGLFSSIWMLIRLIEKPSRIQYPCQRAAFPFVATFLSWLAGTLVSLGLIKYVRTNKGYIINLVGLVLIVLGITVFICSKSTIFSAEVYASEIKFNKYQFSGQSIYLEPEATVSIVKSAKTKADDLTEADIFEMVSEAVQLAGGLESIIQNGHTVILKPNLVLGNDDSNNPALLPKEVNGVTTDYRVTRSVARLVRSLNPDGKIYIIEGSGNSGYPEFSKRTTRDNFITLGYTRELIPEVDSIIALEETSSYLQFSSGNLVSITLPDSIALYPHELKPNKSKEFYLHKIYAQADVVISLPVLKNHIMTGPTGAVKNVGIGSSPNSIYGSGEVVGRWGANFIDHRGTNYFENLHKWIHDYYLCKPVNFAIMDGLQSSDNGPTCGDMENRLACIKNKRLILASKDAVAIDAIESIIIGQDPFKVAHLVYLANDGAGCIDPMKIKITGEIEMDYKESYKIAEPYNKSHDHSKYSDFTPPSIHNIQISLNGNVIQVKCIPDVDVSRIIVKVDGFISKQQIVQNIPEFSIEANSIPTSDSKIEFYVYDSLLNCSRNIYSIKDILLQP